MSHPFGDFPDSLSLFTDSPDDELRYYFNLSRGLLKQRMALATQSELYNRDVAKLRLLEEMIIEQLPAFAPTEEAR